jgi:aspartate aminotransferase
MTVSQLARAIPESPTLRLNEEARVLRERGEAVINLSVGEPKNKAPLNAILSSAARLNTGEIKYVPTDGLPSLKKAVIRYTEENYDRVVGAQNVIVSAGAKQALFNLLYTLINPQDEVVILAPYWVSYPEMVKMVRGVPVIVTPEDGRFQPTLGEVEAVLTSSTRAIIVNSPNNPSGAVFGEDFIAGLVELCERRGIYFIADDIYHKLVFNGKGAPPAYRFTRRDVESSKVIAINGISKLYGMTGFRIGWAVGPREIIQVMANVQAQTTSCVSPVLQAAAEGALNGLQSLVESLRLTIENNRTVMVQELNSVTDVRLIPPDGAFYAFPDMRAYGRDSVAMCDLLLRRARVVVVPGREFGLEGYLRLSFSGTVKDIMEGVARIKWALDPNSPNEIYIGDRKLVRDWL